MKPQDFNDSETQAAWDLLSRHRPIQPSHGFAERTLRRLHAEPVRKLHFWQIPAWRWATAVCLAAVMGLGGWLTYRYTGQTRNVTLAEIVMEDYDVISALHHLEGDNQL